jgi:hypothetical protein
MGFAQVNCAIQDQMIMVGSPLVSFPHWQTEIISEHVNSQKVYHGPVMRDPWADTLFWSALQSLLPESRDTPQAGSNAAIEIVSLLISLVINGYHS